MKRITLCIASLLVVGTTMGCQNAPKRPANVPAAATPIPIPHGYDWNYCWMDKAMNINKCQIFNRGGELLYGGVFLPYDGTGVVPEEALKIDAQHGGGEQWIQLQNGVILIPESDYVAIKKNLDWIKGKRSSP